MVKRLNEGRTPMGEVRDIRPIGDFIYKMQRLLSSMSSRYANAEDLSHSVPLPWDESIQMNYRESFDKLIHAYYDLLESSQYLEKLESELEANFTVDDEEWYGDTEV